MSAYTIRTAWMVLFMVLTAAAASGDTLHVPADYATIQAAIDAAAGGDEIVVAAGTYNEAINFNGKAVYLHSADGPERTIIDATELYISAVTCANDEDSSTVVDGFTITASGYGIYIDLSSPTVTNCVFSRNVDVALASYQGSPTISNCTFIGNAGPAMMTVEGSPTVTNCMFSENAGGGMLNASSSPTVVNCTFSANSSDQGAGMGNYSAKPIVRNCVFNQNIATYSGGAIENSSSNPIVDGCTFTGNQAPNGGAIRNHLSSPIISSCTFRGNIAEVGAGVSNTSESAPFVTFCTFSGNEAGIGGGALAAAGSELSLSNCVLWGNLGATGDELWADRGDYDIPAVIRVAYCNVAGGQDNVHLGEGSTLEWGVGNIVTDPLLVRNPDNGADGWGDNPDTKDIDESQNDDYGDLHLTAGSGCIDAGTKSQIRARSDMDGDCRVADGDDDGREIPDIGADEIPGLFRDCNANGLCDLQEADNDCNHNLVPDDCDLADWTSLDRVPSGGDGVPDECQRVHNTTRDTYSGTIQEAIDASHDGDELLVSAGTYNEAINFRAKAIHLRGTDGPAATIIDAAGLDASAVTCVHGEGAGTILEGFTITGGTGTGRGRGVRLGGGMYIWNSSPTLTRCTFYRNTASAGGGVYSEYGSPALFGCTFIRNTAYSVGAGGGVFSIYGSPTLDNCTFIANSGGYEGGGVYSAHSSPAISNCTLIANSATHGGALKIDSGRPTLANCILWGNVGEISDSTDSVIVTYCDVQGGYSGDGNIDGDPLFARNPSDGGDGWGDNPDTPDFDEGSNDDFGGLRLQSNSPCIDAGDPTFEPPPGATDLDGLFRVWDGSADDTAVVDMGAYEFGSHAYGDLNCDAGVDFNDIDAFVAALAGRVEYEQTYAGCDYLLADVNSDGAVDFGDIDPFVNCLIDGGCN